MTFTEYVQTRSDELAQAFGQHALVVAASMAIATVLGVGVGMLTWRRAWLSGLAIGASGGFLTIPSFALLGLLIPVMGLGWTPTVFALTLYALLPIIRNTVVGLRGVDAAIIEAGRGMGMSACRLLWRVQLPLAWPLILTGIRVSTQMIIGIAAIAAYVDGPGPGQPRSSTGWPGSARQLAERGPRRNARRRDRRAALRPVLPHRPPVHHPEGSSCSTTVTGARRSSSAEFTKRYPGPGDPAVDSFSPDVPAGELVVFVGPSGLRQDDHHEDDQPADRADLGQRSPSAARTCCRLHPDELRRHIGYVIQQIGLFPHLTIAQNIAVVPKLLGWARQRITDRVDELLGLVGLDPASSARATPASCPAASSSGSVSPARSRPTRR